MATIFFFSSKSFFFTFYMNPGGVLSKSEVKEEITRPYRQGYT
jgi:hypothetical protein